eukprot:c44568_g1_i1 orf=1-276(-)
MEKVVNSSSSDFVKNISLGATTMDCWPKLSVSFTNYQAFATKDCWQKLSVSFTKLLGFHHTVDCWWKFSASFTKLLGFHHYRLFVEALRSFA